MASYVVRHALAQQTEKDDEIAHLDAMTRSQRPDVQRTWHVLQVVDVGVAAHTMTMRRARRLLSTVVEAAQGLSLTCDNCRITVATTVACQHRLVPE
jgi:hypothetical protein